MRTATAVAAVGGIVVGVAIGAALFRSEAPAPSEPGVEAVAERPGPGEEGMRERTEPSVRWKMAAIFPRSLVLLGVQGERFIARLGAISGGDIELKYYDPGALVPALEVFDSVASGAVDTGWSTPGLWAGKVPALQFFTSVPFGPEAGEFLGWVKFGGGRALLEEIYHRHNIHPLICNMTSPEGSGWFREPIESLDDLKGLKMRFFGLGAKVIEKLGVSTQLLAPGDIFPALELGTIDATEFSMPVIDQELGFDQVAKHYYFPGWHQPSSLGELIVNLDRWRSLDDTQKAQFEAACWESVLRGLAEGEALQGDALRTLQARGVTLHRWGPEFLDAYEAAWQTVVAEQAAADPDFARVWESLSAFRETYSVWKAYGYLD
jgi:TRAP-type mannitol/chloroaromatic compound transport system substrate-binding protein